MIFDRFYHYLWVYHDFMKKQYGKIKVSVPDTIVFLRQLPKFYYYTDKEGFIASLFFFTNSLI